MKLFTPRKTADTSDPADLAATLEQISARLDKLERVVTDLKQHIDLIPAIVRKLYLDGMPLPARTATRRENLIGFPARHGPCSADSPDFQCNGDSASRRWFSAGA